MKQLLFLLLLIGASSCRKDDNKDGKPKHPERIPIPGWGVDKFVIIEDWTKLYNLGDTLYSSIGSKGESQITCNGQSYVVWIDTTAYPQPNNLYSSRRFNCNICVSETMESEMLVSYSSKSNYDGPITPNYKEVDSSYTSWSRCLYFDTSFFGKKPKVQWFNMEAIKNYNK